MDAKMSTATVAVTTGVGVAIGYAVGGSAGVTHGAKIGGALGAQIVGKVNDTEKKEKKGKDSGGRTVENIGKKIVSSMDTDKLKEKMLDTTIDIAQTWSTFMLLGYGMQLAFCTSKDYTDLYNVHCDSFFESMTCASTALTTISLNSAVSFSGIAMLVKGVQLLFKEKNTPTKDK